MERFFQKNVLLNFKVDWMQNKNIRVCLYVGCLKKYKAKGQLTNDDDDVCQADEDE